MPSNFKHFMQLIDNTQYWIILFANYMLATQWLYCNLLHNNVFDLMFQHGGKKRELVENPAEEAGSSSRKRPRVELTVTL